MKVSAFAINIYHAWRHNPSYSQDTATTLCTQMAVDGVSERQPAELKWRQTQWDSVLGRMLALLFSLPCFPMPSSTTTAAQRERERGWKEISPLQRQSGRRQQRGENKSAPVWSMVTKPWQGNSTGRQCGSWEGVEEDCVREDSDIRGIMSFYCMSPCTWPHWCLLTVAPPFLMLHNPTPSMNPVMCAQTRTSSFASSSSSSSSRSELELPRFIKPVQQWLTWDTGYYQDKKRPYWVDGSQEWGSDNKRGRLRQKAYWTIYTLRNIREHERLEDQSDGLFLKMKEMEYLIGSGAVIILMYAVISDSVIETSIRFESPKYFKPTHAILCFHVLECSGGLIWLQCFQRMTSILWCNPVRRVTVQSSSTLDEIAKDSFYQCHFVKHKTKHVLES